MWKTFEQHLHLSPGELETFSSHSLADFLNLPVVNQLLSSLDTDLLRQTLPTTKVVLAEQLPPFYEWLQYELGVKRIPDSPDHTTEWVVNFLNSQESLTRLVELHRPVPGLALERSISRLVAMFEGVEDIYIRQEWQKAIAALCLILVVAARSDERSVQVTV